MHEISIAESIIDIAADYARRDGVDSFCAIDLEIGKLSGIELDALNFALEVVCRDTVLDGADIRIATIPGRARCDECQVEFEVEDFFAPCPECGDTRCTVIGGEELRVASLFVNE